MYFTVSAPLHPYNIATLCILTVDVPLIPIQLITNEEQLRPLLQNTPLLRLGGAWLLLEAHEAISAEGNYEFIVTLLVKPQPSTCVVVQTHYSERFHYLLIGLQNHNTNTIAVPCILYDLRVYVNLDVATALRDHIQGLPCETHPLRDVEQ